MPDKIIVNISSTALGKAACILNFHRTVIDGFKPLALPARVVYGIAVHKFLDTMYKSGENIVAARDAAKIAFALTKDDDKKSLHLSDERHMLNSCINLWATFIQEESTFDLIMLGDKPATEVTFSIPYFEDDYIIVNLAGTIDKVGQFKGGCYAIGDWKTTSSWDKNNYFEQYELSRQLRFYTLACKLMSQREPESTLGRIGSTKMGAFIDAIFIKPDANDNDCRRSDIFTFSDGEIKEFQNTLDRFILKLSRRIKESLIDKEGILNGSCEGRWGKCSFWNVCKSPDHIADIMLKKYFKQVIFNPLDYNDL